MGCFPEQFTPLQRDFLSAFFDRETRFSLIGGGALAYYLPKRRVRDLDLVGSQEAVLAGQVAVLREIARGLGAQIAFPDRSARLLRCSIHRAGEFLQIDLSIRTASIRIGEKTRFGAVLVASLPTLAAHKLLTLYERSRLRDLRDLSALLELGLPLATVVEQTLLRQPDLDLASLYAAIVSWPERVAPEEAAELAELEPFRHILLCGLRGLCFDIAHRRASLEPALPRSLSPLQRDVLHAFYLREQRFCLTGSAALAFYAPGWLVDRLELYASPDADLASAWTTLEQVATVCGGKTRIVHSSPGIITVRIERDSETCLLDILTAQYTSLPLPYKRFGEVVVESPRALAAHSLVSLERRRRVTDLLVLKSTIELGVSIRQAICDGLALARKKDLISLLWAVATLQAPEDSLAAPFQQASPFRAELLREVRWLARAEARGHSRPRVDEILIRDGAQPASGRNPMLYLMGGGFGSGKSALKRLLTERGELPSTQVVRLDPDEILASLPTYQALIKKGRLREAAAIRAESDAIAREILRRAIDMKADIIYDIALAKPDSATEKIQTAKGAGYEVHLIGATVDAEAAIARAATRTARTGRYTATDDLLASHRGFSEGFLTYVSMVDSAKLYDTHGEQPTLIASRDASAGGELNPLKVHDPDLYDRFKIKADLDLPRTGTVLTK